MWLDLSVFNFYSDLYLPQFLFQAFADHYKVINYSIMFYGFLNTQPRSKYVSSSFFHFVIW